VLSKVAVRRRAGVRPAARPVSLVVGLGADYVHRVSTELGGERIHVVQWQGDPARYIADALGLGHVPPIEVSPSRRLASVLLGDIDVRGARGRRGVNLLLASALTGWRIRLREIARSPASAAPCRRWSRRVCAKDWRWSSMGCTGSFRRVRYVGCVGVPRGRRWTRCCASAWVRSFGPTCFAWNLIQGTSLFPNACQPDTSCRFSELRSGCNVHRITRAATHLAWRINSSGWMPNAAAICLIAT
jgi:hypothetical protein